MGSRAWGYVPWWPAFVEHDNPSGLCFTVAVDDRAVIRRDVAERDTEESVARRSYVTSLVRRRMHQQSFRERVLQAYREHCAVCRLKHYELLEAAHILPETHPRGEPVVSHGLALCSLHHAAFDSNIIGIRPDLLIEIRSDILEEIDLEVGHKVWARFKGGKDGTLWYYISLVETFEKRGEHRLLVDELARTVAELQRLASST